MITLLISTTGNSVSGFKDEELLAVQSTYNSRLLMILGTIEDNKCNFIYDIDQMLSIVGSPS